MHSRPALSVDSLPAPFEPTRTAVLLVRVAYLAICAASVQALRSGLAGRPEWCYLRAAGSDAAAMLGPDQPMFGYLPGVFGILRGLLSGGEVTGLVVLTACNGAAAMRLMQMICRGLPGVFVEPPAKLRPWLHVLCAVTLVPAIRNSQLVVPSMLLVVYGLRANRSLVRAALLAIAVVLKTLPAVLLGLLLVRGDVRTVRTALLVLAATSYALAALALGWHQAWYAHLDWPAQVSAHEPTAALRGAFVPSLNDNQSIVAVAVRVAPWWLAPALPGLRYALLATLTFLTVAATWRHRHELDCTSTLPVWLAYTVLAAPFCRYYYVPLLLPGLAYELSQRAGGGRLVLGAVATVLVCLARCDVALIALASGAFVLAWRRLRSQSTMQSGLTRTSASPAQPKEALRRAEHPAMVPTAARPSVNPLHSADLP